MTRVSFYIVKGTQNQDRQAFACRLIEKAYLQGNQVYIHTENEQAAQQVDSLLWSFRQDSFVPHELMNASDDVEGCPILIGHNTSPPRLMDLLVNLSDQQPLFFSQFERMAEIISDNEQTKNKGRERYRFYQQRGYQLESHTL